MRNDAAEKLKEGKNRTQQNLSLMLGLYVSQERIRRKLTQEKLGEMVGLSPNHISKIERGCGDVKTSNLLRICLALGLSLDAFVLEHYLDNQPEAVSYRKALQQQWIEMDMLQVQETVSTAIEQLYKRRGL